MSEQGHKSRELLNSSKQVLSPNKSGDTWHLWLRLVTNKFVRPCTWQSSLCASSMLHWWWESCLLNKQSQADFTLGILYAWVKVHGHASHTPLGCTLFQNGHTSQYDLCTKCQKIVTPTDFLPQGFTVLYTSYLLLTSCLQSGLDPRKFLYFISIFTI